MGRPPKALSSQAPKARVIREVRAWILGQKLQSGDPLPAERQLADHLGVARNTLRAALQELEDEGWITTTGKTRRVTHDVVEIDRTNLMEQTLVVISPIAGDHSEVSKQPWREGSYVLTRAAQQLEAEGFALLFVSPDNLTAGQWEQLIASHPAGILAALSRPKIVTFLQTAQSAGLRPVTFGRNPELSGCDQVYPDHRQATYEQTRYLIESGRRHIVCGWFQSEIPLYLQERYEGYKQAMQQAGFEVQPPILSSYTTNGYTPTLTHEQHVEACTTVLSEHLQRFQIDAVLTPSDAFVARVAGACAAMGRSVHEQISISGYDNHWSSEMTTKPATTVEKHNEKAACLLAELVLANIRGTGSESPGEHPVACTLKVL